MTGVAIRPLIPADGEVYRALRLRGLAEHPDAFTSDFAQEAAKSVATLARRLAPPDDAPDNRMFGAFDGSALIGVVGFEVEPRTKTHHKGHVFGMYVLRERAGQGIGRVLVETLVAHARGVRGLAKLDLTVTATNASARALYERAGFVAWGVEQDATRVDGVAYAKVYMTKRLETRG